MVVVDTGETEEVVEMEEEEETEEGEATSHRARTGCEPLSCVCLSLVHCVLH